MTCKEGHFDIVELIVNHLKTFGINLNAQHINGITLFDFAVHVRLLDTLGFMKKVACLPP